MSSYKEEQERKRRFWREQLNACQESGLTISAYCKKHNLVRHQFKYWESVLGSTTRQHSTENVLGLVEAHVEHQVSTTSSTTTFTLTTPTGITLTLPCDLPHARLNTLLLSIRSALC